MQRTVTYFTASAITPHLRAVLLDTRFGAAVAVIVRNYSHHCFIRFATHDVSPLTHIDIKWPWLRERCVFSLHVCGS